MTDFSSTSTPTRTMSLSDQSDQTETLEPLPAAQAAAEPAAESVAQPAPKASPRLTTTATQRTALVVLVGIAALAVAFIVMLLVGVSSESINALAVFATPIASMVAAYYGITLSIQQVRSERAEKEKAIARADAADAASRETEVWASQMESGLRVAMAQLTAARIGTDSVTKAAGTPDDFF